MIVPHRNLVKYDRKGFHGFLERLGHSDHDLFAMLGDSNKIHMAESILQEWLYFGTLDMLSEISSVPIDLDQFINVDEHGVRTVTSKHWPEYFAVISKKETPFDKKQHERLEAGLNDVARILGSVTGRFESGTIIWSRPSFLASLSSLRLFTTPSDCYQDSRHILRPRS